MGQSFSFAGVDLSAAAFGVTVVRSHQSFSAPPRYTAPEVPYSYGSLYNHTGYRPRIITLNCLIEAEDDHGDIQAQIDRMNALFSRPTPAPLMLDRLPDRYWMAVLESPIEGVYVGGLAAHATLKFLAPDPRAYALSEETVSGSGSFQIDMAGLGSAHADPVWTCAGGDTSITLVNTTTNERFTFVGETTLPGLIIDSRQESLVCRYTEMDDPVMSGVAGVFPRLAPGVVNEIECSTSVTAKFIPRFL